MPDQREIAADTSRPRSGSRVRTVRLLVGDRASLVIKLGIASVLAALSEALILTVAAAVATTLVDGRHSVGLGLGVLVLHVAVGPLLLVTLGIAVVRLLLQFGVAHYPALIAGNVQLGLRRELFAAYTAASWEQQSQDREGHFQELMTNQITIASWGALAAAGLVVSAFTVIVLAATAFVLDVVAAVIVLAAAAVLFILLRPLNALGARYASRLSTAQLEYAGGISEASGVAEEVQVFGVGAPVRGRVDDLATAARSLFVRTQFVGRFVPGAYQAAVYMILVGGLIAVSGTRTAGLSSLGAVILLLVRAGSHGQQFQGSYQLVRQSLPYLERLQDTTTKYLASQPSTGSTRLEAIETVEFVGVGYEYRSDRPALSDVTWEVARGETVGIVGPSGAGKSTLAQIMLRLRAPQHGSYLINGRPASDYQTEDWDRLVAYVPQHPRLVHASVADNVRFFRDIDDAAVERACHLARIHDDIIQWPAGYETFVGPRADAVSGGQQQRICLARALAGRPGLLILDEPTSALDSRSEALIQQSLASLHEELTLFIVAHRMSTLTICDRVLVMLDGTLDAFETPAELEQSNRYYQVASNLA